ncbi:MAG: hypothetical protein DHS20C15_10560 [Planctomycetota bacterium]|nr:MAG: hypothetical protein DHS20C15_10560 [Planctomycetota bacterium]
MFVLSALVLVLPACQMFCTDAGIWEPVADMAPLEASVTCTLNTHYEKPDPLNYSEVANDAEHAYRAYESQAAIQAEFGDDVLQSDGLASLIGLDYYIVTTKRAGREVQLVAVAGTDVYDFKDIAADLAIDRVRDAVTQLDFPEGFSHAATVIDKSLAGQLKQDVPVHFVGHSLGGALSTILALRFSRKNFEVSATTFGAPKVTSLRSILKNPWVHELPIHRFTLDEDIFGHWPPPRDNPLNGSEALLANYAQFGQEWILTTQGRCDFRDMREALLNTSVPTQALSPSSWNLSTHAPELYVERTQALAAPKPKRTPAPESAPPASE